MIHSIRRFLLASLLASIIVASIIIMIGNYLTDQHIVQAYQDKQLIKDSIILSNIIKTNTLKSFEKTIPLVQKEDESVLSDIIIQIWDKKNNLLAYLGKHPKHFKPKTLGFSYLIYNNGYWRVFSKIYKDTGYKIVVAEHISSRKALTDHLALNNTYILMASYPILGLLIWFIISYALQCIKQISSEISHRASTFLEPVDTKNVPKEIKPLIKELNSLFQRLRLAFERNKRFAGDAAHELRTPLAALKTQTQVALKAKDSKTRKEALLKVINNVDRSSHVISQLLTLSRLTQEENLTDINTVNLHKLATEIIAYLVPVALEKNIEIDLSPPPKNPNILANDTAIGILIRNIVDNAIRYTPPNGEVHISILSNHNVTLRVVDTGPGVPENLRERVFERFYRIIGTIESGSGLGLAIVKQIADLHNAEVKLSTPENGVGLQLDVIFPKYKKK